MAAVGLGTVRLLLDRIIPALAFGVITVPWLGRLAQAWMAPVELSVQSQLMYVLDIGHAALSFVFMALLTVLFMFRRPTISGRAAPLAMAIALGGTFSMWFAFIQPRTTEDWLVFAIADVLMIAGLAFAAYAFGALRRCFGIAPEARGLVTTGAYRWVRHPAYLGEFVMAFGGLLPVLAPFTALVFALFCILQARRAALEEVVLSATFAEYAAYRRRTPALLPWPRSIRAHVSPIRAAMADRAAVS
jgi:protein-S-isoprenylcysteine O-methyltransferase Ste14